MRHNSQTAEADVPIIESLQNEIERMQRLEQRSALLKSAQSGELNLRWGNCSCILHRFLMMSPQYYIKMQQMSCFILQSTYEQCLH